MEETICRLGDGYTIRKVTDMGGFNSLRPEWDRLLENHTSHVPFLCFDWFRVWLKHFLKNNELFILLLYHNEQLVAIAPFVICSENYKGVLKTRKVCLIGNVYSPIKTLIFQSADIEDRAECLRHIFNYFCNTYKDWDLMEFDSIPEEDRNFEILKTTAGENGFKGRDFFSFNDWVLDEINFSGEEYMRCRPKNLRKELGKRKRRLQRKGDLRFEVGTDKNNFDYYMGLYDEVRDKSWKYPEADKFFLSEFRKVFMEKGWLRFSVLFFDGAPISCHLRIIYNQSAYFLESVYDLEYKAFSPTTILRSELIQYVIDKENARIIHSIRGDEPYKRNWTPTCWERRGITIFNNTLKGQALGFLMTKVLPAVEKHPGLLSAKNRLSGYLKNRRQL
jgi:CelD/BcsL family acetyltransferase involved in cellulose biosynthesis